VTPDPRAPERKTGCLTMYRYQEMPHLPAVSNKRQEAIVAQAEELAPACQKIERKKPKINPESRKKAGKTATVNHTKRVQQEVAQAFSAGPLSITDLMHALKLNNRFSANYRMRDFLARGLIVEHGTRPTGSVNGQMEKLWRKA